MNTLQSLGSRQKDIELLADLSKAAAALAKVAYELGMTIDEVLPIVKGAAERKLKEM